MSKNLIDAYLNTRYCVDQPFLEIRIGKMNTELDALLDEHHATTWAFISAWNPRSVVLEKSANAERHRQLGLMLNTYSIFEGKGVGEDPAWEPECSFLVLGISQTLAEYIGTYFDQNAIVFGSKNGLPELMVLRQTLLIQYKQRMITQNTPKDFTTYYRSKFPEDLGRYLVSIPRELKYHEDPDEKIIISFQPYTLDRASKYLTFLTRTEYEYFGMSLYFQVLMDMVFYTYYSSYYWEFQSMTHYPKFIGNCLRACKWHMDPEGILDYLRLLGTNRSSLYPHFHERFNEAAAFFETESLTFFQQKMPEVNGQIFWEYCKREFPINETV